MQSLESDGVACQIGITARDGGRPASLERAPSTIMRILIVAPEEGEIGGVASVIGNLSRYLQKQGNEITIFYLGASTFARMKTTTAGIPAVEMNLQMPFGERNAIFSLILFLIRFPVALIELIRIIRNRKIQIVNVHYPTDVSWYFALCRKMLSFA